jgi:hypothetical protein
MPAGVSAPGSHCHGNQGDNARQTKRAKTHRHVWGSPQKKAKRSSRPEAGSNAPPNAGHEALERIVCRFGKSRRLEKHARSG